MTGWALFAVLFVIALIFWISAWKIIKWVFGKFEGIFTTKFGRK